VKAIFEQGSDQSDATDEAIEVLTDCPEHLERDAPSI